MLVLETIQGRYRVVLREAAGGAAVTIWDRGTVYPGSLKVRGAGTPILDKRVKGAFAEIATAALAKAQALEDATRSTARKE